MVKGSSILTALSHPLDTLASMTGADKIQEAKKDYDAGDKKGAALKLMQYAQHTLNGGPAGDMAQGLLDASKDQGSKAWDAFKSGDYHKAANHAAAAMVPIFAPAAEGADQVNKGLADLKAGPDYPNQTAGERLSAVLDNPDVREGVGTVAGNAFDFVAPELGGKVVEAAPAAGRIVADAGKGAWKGATAPTTLPIKIKGVPLGEVNGLPAAVTGAATGAGVGAFVPGVGPVVGGAVGAAVPVVKGAIAGVREGMAARAAGPSTLAQRLAEGRVAVAATDAAAGTAAPAAAAIRPEWNQIAKQLGGKDYASMSGAWQDKIRMMAGEPAAATPPPLPRPAAPPPLPQEPAATTPAEPEPAATGPRTPYEIADEIMAQRRAEAAAAAPPPAAPPEPTAAPAPPAAAPPEPATAAAPPAETPSEPPAPVPSAPPADAPQPAESAHYAALRKTAGDRGADAAIAKDQVIVDWIRKNHPEWTGADIKPGQAFKDMVDGTKFEAGIKNPNGKSGKFTTRINDADHVDRVQAVADELDRKIARAKINDAGTAARAAGAPDQLIEARERLGRATVGDPNATPDSGQTVQAPTGAQGAAGAEGAPPVATAPAAGVDAGAIGTRQALPEQVRAGGEGSPGASVQGNRTRIDVPGEARSYQGHYEVGELADSQPSHHGATFQKNPRYQLRNDRNYDNPVNQGKIVNWSTADPETGYKPANLINTAPDSSSGPPVQDSAGNVLGGNGRTMIQQRVAASNPAGAQAYRALLDQSAAHYGIDPASYAHMKEPFLRRVVDDAEFSRTGSKQDAVTNFNKSGTAALTPSEQAVADSRRVSQGTLEELAQRLDAKGPDGTLAQVLEGKSGLEMLGKLVDDGVISPQEHAKLATETQLTKAGKERVSGLMLGRFFENSEQMDVLPAELKNKIERIAAPAARVEGGDYSLSPTLKKSLGLIEHAQATGMSIDDHLQQTGMFSDDKYPPQAVALAKQLQSRGAINLTDAVRQYAERAKYAAEYQGPGMFGEFPEPHTPAQAFEESFGPKALADEAAAKIAAKAAKQPAAEPAPGLLDRVMQGAKELLIDKTGSVRIRGKSSAAAYDDAHQTSMFGDPEPAATPAGDAGTAAALKDAMTKQLKYGGPPSGRTIGGPLFDQQEGMFGAPAEAVQKTASALKDGPHPASGQERIIDAIQAKGFSRVDALKAVQTMLKMKVAKFDALGQFSVKHGMFLEPDVIRNAIAAWKP